MISGNARCEEAVIPLEEMEMSLGCGDWERGKEERRLSMARVHKSGGSITIPRVNLNFGAPPVRY